MNKKLAVWGWWQGHNLGDNWIKHTISRLFPGTAFINTDTRDFSAYDFVICGGGGLFIYDTIAPWTNYAQKTPYGMLGLGAEFPHKTDNAYKLSRNAAFFYVRDQYSLDCMKISDIERSYDITFAEPLSFEENDNLNMNKLFFVWRDGAQLSKNEQFKIYICYENNKEDYMKIICREFTDIISDDFQTYGYDIKNKIGDCGFVISGRYHGIVAAIQKGLPCIALDICPKLRVIMKDCGLEEYCVKINETDKLPHLINKARGEIGKIREKQYYYRQKAFITINDHIKTAKDVIGSFIT